MTDRKTALTLAFALVCFALPPIQASADEIESPGDIETPEAEPEEPEEPIDYGRSGVYLELDGHATIPVGRGPRGGDSGGPGARAGWRFAGLAALELQYEWTAKLDVNPANLMTVNAKVFILTNRIQPFVRAGLGAIFGKAQGSSGLKSSFVARFGIGVDYWVTGHWAASLFGDYVLPTDHFSRLTHFSVGAGARYRF